MYVGSTTNVHRRMASHRKSSAWWPLHSSLDVEEFGTEEHARYAEGELICEFGPPYNVRASSGHPGERCSGLRCSRLRETVERLDAARRLRVNRSRRRRVPPLAEWDEWRQAEGFENSGEDTCLATTGPSDEVTSGSTETASVTSSGTLGARGFCLDRPTAECRYSASGRRVRGNRSRGPCPRPLGPHPRVRGNTRRGSRSAGR